MVGGSDVDGLLDQSRVVIWAARENAGVLPVNRMAGSPHMLSQGRRIEISCPGCSLVLRQRLAKSTSSLSDVDHWTVGTGDLVDNT